MAYAAQYEPTYKRRDVRKMDARHHDRRQAGRGKKIYDSTLRKLVKKHLADFEHDFTMVGQIERDVVIRKLHLFEAASYATCGDHALQKLCADGAVSRPTRSAGGKRVFDRATLMRELHAYIEQE